MKFFSKTYVPVKTFASNDFLNIIGKAKKDLQVNLDANIKAFEQSFQDAVNTLGEFSRDNNPLKLKKAATDFLNLIKYRPSQVEPYVYMSYILFLYDQKAEALKYIKLSEAIDPDYHFIQKVKTFIYS